MLDVIKQQFASRKFRAAVAGTLVILAAKAQMHISEDLVYGIVTLFSIHILGVAIEDAAAKSAAKPVEPPVVAA